MSIGEMQDYERLIELPSHAQIDTRRAGGGEGGGGRKRRRRRRREKMTESTSGQAAVSCDLLKPSIRKRRQQQRALVHLSYVLLSLLVSLASFCHLHSSNQEHAHNSHWPRGAEAALQAANQQPNWQQSSHWKPHYASHLHHQPAVQHHQNANNNNGSGAPVSNLTGGARSLRTAPVQTQDMRSESLAAAASSGQPAPFAVRAAAAAAAAAATTTTSAIRSHQQVASNLASPAPASGRRQVIDSTVTIATLPMTESPPSDAGADFSSTSSLPAGLSTGDDNPADSSSGDSEEPSSGDSSSDELPDDAPEVERRSDDISTTTATTSSAVDDTLATTAALPGEQSAASEESGVAAGPVEGIHLRPSRHSTPVNDADEAARRAAQAPLVMRAATTTRAPGVQQAFGTSLRTASVQGGGGGDARSVTRGPSPTRLTSSATATSTTTTSSASSPVVVVVATTTTTTARPSQQPAAVTRDRSTSGASFDVSVGTDRMLIKPAAHGPSDDFDARLLSSAPTPLADRSGRGTVAPTFFRQAITVPSRVQATTSRQLPLDAEASRGGDLGGESPEMPPPSSHAELTNESITHHKHVTPASEDLGGEEGEGHEHGTRQEDAIGSVSGSASEQAAAPTTNERLMYPPASNGAGSSGYTLSRAPSTINELQQQQQYQQRLEAASLTSMANICYTPFSLFMVILLTIVMTLIISFCTLHLFRYLKRHHQFDLVANSKHFDHKHLSSSSGYLQGSAGAANLSSGATSASALHAYHSMGVSPAAGCGAGANERQSADGACVLHPFQRDDQCNKCLALSSPFGAAHRSSSGALVSHEPSGGGMHAFRNPYFADEQPGQLMSGGCAKQPSRSPPLRPSDTTRTVRESEWSHSHKPWETQQSALQPVELTTSLGGGLLRTAPGSSDQMHFIENHIANLHNRQVTSSVRELSSLGDSGGLVASPPPPLAQVVDLTSDEQRARVRANPREGDLVAVDLSGHDIIGLGFEVCGGMPRDNGIYVRSVSAHGPASESGCVSPGDRIKCLNVSLESMTLRDARDILNCAAPYKMRLLIEKRMASGAELKKMQGATKLYQQPPPGRLSARSSHQAASPNRSHLALDTTRAYLRQLTSKILGGHDDHDHDQSTSARVDAASRATDGAGASQQVVAPMSSLAARQQAHLRLGSASVASYLDDNDACSTITTNDEDERDERDHRVEGNSTTIRVGRGGSDLCAAAVGREVSLVHLKQRQQSHALPSEQPPGGLGQSAAQRQLGRSEREQEDSARPRQAHQQQQQQQQLARVGQRRGESCHSNEAFRADDDDDDNDDDGADDYLPHQRHQSPGRHSSSTNSGGGGGRRDARRDDEDAARDERLFHYDSQQSKQLMSASAAASGQTFNSKSRLTM